jgi:hypothetical protein
VLRIFGPKGEQKESNDEEIYIMRHFIVFNSSPNIIRMVKLRTRSVTYVAPKGVKRNAYRILIKRPEG